MNTLATQNQQHPLNWIKPELEKTITTIRDLFESYSQELEDETPVEKIETELHLLHGSFEMLELHGAALLVEDMEKAIKAIHNSNKKSKEDIFEALLHATLTLETYIDKLDVRNNGVPASLLPIINDIRASIKEPLLSEGALFSPNLSIVPKIPLHTHPDEKISAQLKSYASKLRPYYQAALLSWYRNPEDNLSLQQMRLVARNFESACFTPRNRQVWWILGGLLEAMIDKGLSNNVSLRLILGQTDRIIKSFTQGDTKTFEETPPIEFLKNTLYYISQASSEGERVTSLKQIYKLENAVPSEDDISFLQQSSNAPSSETFTLIAEELTKSLDQIKATIENFVRNTQDNPVRLKQTLTPLKHVSDTLSLLNLGAEKQKLQEQITIIAEIITTNKAPSSDTMLEIAAAILDVETSLQNIGTRSNNSPATSDYQQGDSLTPKSELTKIAERTALEAQSNIAEIKNHILSYLSSNQTQKGILESVPKLLTEIKGCLIILNNEQASKITNALLEYVNEEILERDEGIPSSNLDTLAETIVSLEYYFETVTDSNASTESIIEMARKSVNRLGFSIPPIDDEENDTSAMNDVANIRDLDPNKVIHKQKKEEQRFSRIHKKESGDDNIVSISPEQIDDEVANIFIEEAIEVLESMRGDLRTLQFSMDDPTALSSIRKTFHTLKGSGRTAGAIHISELAALLNDYLSRVVCGALKADERIINILDDSHKLMHELIECFKARTTPADDYTKITNKVKDIIGPIPEPPQIIPKLSEVIPITKNIKTAKPKESQQSENKSDPTQSSDELEIQEPADKIQALLHTSLTQISIIDEFAASPYKRDKNKVSQEEMLAAVATLRECAALSNAREFIHTTDLLAKYITNACEKESGLSRESIEILKEFCATTREILFDLSHTLSAADISGEIPVIENKPEDNTEQKKNESSSTIEQKEEESASQQALSLVEAENSDSQIAELTISSEPEKTHSEQTNRATIEPLELDQATQANETTPLDNVVEDFSKKADDENRVAEKFDPDLIDIFMEEAIELIESANNIIEEYENNNDTNKLYAAIQRVLHTMKGSARMAGLNYVGDISHLLETQIESVSAKRTPHPDNLIETLQNCFDSINDTIEDIRAGKPVYRHQELLDKISGKEPQSSSETAEQAKAPASVISMEKGNETATEIDTLSNDDSNKAEKTTHNTSQVPELTETPPPEIKTSTQAEPNTNQEEQKQAQTTPENNVPIERRKTARSEKTGQKPASKSAPVKVNADILDKLVDQASEESAINNRVEDHISTIKSNLFEMDKTVARALAQMRDLQFEAHNLAEQNSKVSDQFDMDTELNLSTFSEGQKITQRLMESFGDIESLHGLLTRLTLETDTLIIQQKKIHSELQENLIGTRMVTFSVQTQRMQRILRQTCISLRKKAKLTLEGTDGSVDRGILETLMGPMEHIIRNAAAHGIESPSARKKINKRDSGSVHIKFSKDRSEHLIEISDDGAGIDLERVKEKALSVGLITAEDKLSDDELCNLIFKPGFSTCNEVSQISGRGVGMDVAINEIRQLGGTLSVSSTPGEGSVFTIRLPFTVSSNHTLFVKIGKNTYALPSNMIEHTFTIPQPELETLYQSRSPSYTFREQDYPLWNMEALLNNEPIHLPEKHIDSHIVLLRNGAHKIALQVDEVNESRDSVLKPASPQLSNIRGIAGATVLGDGKVVLIIDVPSLILYAEGRDNSTNEIVHADGDDDETIKALVVDDSITVRKVTERFLNRHNIKAYTAIDGVDALNVMEGLTPDIMLVDIEMPNMDGLELAQRIRNSDKFKNIPIIMITSRTGNQHRDAAREIGVNAFLPKPYQETELVENIQSLTGKHILVMN